MRTANFPARVERRRLRAQMAKDQKTEPSLSDLLSARSVQTKKARK